MMLSSEPWWRTDVYDVEDALPSQIVDLYSGPEGPALVRAWPNGNTDKGWGLVGPNGDEGFMPRYNRNEFNSRRILFGFERDRWAFALVMRSVRLVCIDIDGKNGGFDHAKKLGVLPPTLAEISKSGNGYHLFYSVEDDWDVDAGYAKLSDRIGIETGVDIRATGCVYHHKQQRWNERDIVPLPKHLYELLHSRAEKVAATTERIQKVLANEDPLEVLMMHEDLLSELRKPIPAGKRNNTLFAIGSQMFTAQVPEWQEAISDRASEVGLDGAEITKLILNIEKYGATVAP